MHLMSIFRHDLTMAWDIAHEMGRNVIFEGVCHGGVLARGIEAERQSFDSWTVQASAYGGKLVKEMEWVFIVKSVQ
jgi:hypothetical protein